VAVILTVLTSYLRLAILIVHCRNLEQLSASVKKLTYEKAKLQNKMPCWGGGGSAKPNWIQICLNGGSVEEEDWGKVDRVQRKEQDGRRWMGEGDGEEWMGGERSEKVDGGGELGERG
jgi:hypothetical protein